jgi:hemoglobin
MIVEDVDDNATIYQRVGRKPAITAVTNDFVGRVVADPAINGYFLNNTVDAVRLTTCLVRQVCAVTGGPCRYGEGVEAELDRDGDGAADVCADMTSVHLGLGISQNDYNDLAGHLVGALSDAGVAQADIDTIAAVLTDPGFVSTIVEDPNSDRTVYQRVGRKPAITAVVNDFVSRVVSDSTLVGFFATADANRLGTCLVRQVCSIDGPCVYGAGVEDSLMINGQVVACRDMMTVHAMSTNPPGGSGAGITIADFNQLVGHLVDALGAAGVPMADTQMVVDALAPLCPDIVAGGAGC